ncbi:hypothetical protein [Pseudescherichia sp.]|uniref:hypothetical protein n=1 Tax=Pseudescherichia sp. TaxID=2055881 RepID=UPI0028B0D2A5|nr:hypothetical protein [Pseudescherichia sp.]
MKLFRRPVSWELALGTYFLSDHVLLVTLYPTAAHKLSCIYHALASLLFAIWFLAIGFTKWRK